eukprot:jgi/Ulvmu1/4325/UM002_0048.1
MRTSARGGMRPVDSRPPRMFRKCTAMPQLAPQLDDRLSSRSLSLDEAGYFVIAADAEASEIVAKYFANTINEAGEACDPDTGEVIPCGPGYTNSPVQVFRGKSAKELSVQILEKQENSHMCSHMEHANYLGREFQKAEFCLLTGEFYIQD